LVGDCELKEGSDQVEFGKSYPCFSLERHLTLNVEYRAMEKDGTMILSLYAMFGGKSNIFTQQNT